MKHTPGPWTMKGHYLGTERPLPYRVETVEPNICEMASSLAPDIVTANAHLIAAAPEMLEALIAQTAAMENWFAAVSDRFGILSDEIDKYQDVQEISRAAIAKAEGK